MPIRSCPSRRISYLDATTRDLKFLKCNDASCSSTTIRTVDNSGNVVGLYPSIARGFDVQLIEPALEIITQSDPLWDWPESFIRSNVPRLVELGDMSETAAQNVLAAWEAASARPQTRMITPLTAQILAKKPR